MKALKRILAASVIIAIAASDVASAQAPASQPQAGQDRQITRPEDLPWAVRLGLRVNQVEQAVPLLDRVVLVPDAATYVDELLQWSPKGRWPVLFEDDIYAPLFVRRFAPSQLIRRAPVGRPLPDDPAVMKQLVEHVVSHAFGASDPMTSAAEAFRKVGYAPPGVVIASVRDPSWTAALALAAGRGELPAWLDDDFGAPSDELDDARARALMGAVEDRLKACGWKYDELGDDVEAITICRAMAGRAKMNLPPELRVNEDGGPLAVTDILGRRANGRRYAFAGWIFGDQKRSAYMAMCAMFLPRERATMVNTYPVDGQWGQYGVAAPAGVLRQQGFDVTEISGPRADDKGWLRLLAGGVRSDLFIMNTKGNADFFDMSAGRAWFPDVPVLDEPCALHLIHSWSMQSPGNVDSVGGRWLDHGAYAAVGSCWEPFLGAFMPPESLVKRVVSFVPFAVAARFWDDEGMFSRPWRVNVIGDPLMLAAPPEKVRRSRAVPPPVANGLELHEHVKTLMKKAADEGDGDAFGDAMRILDMLGRDDVAAAFWKVAQSKGKERFAARAALGPLFRTRNAAAFLEAWQALPTRDPLAADMLWHLFQTRLGPDADKDVLLQLQAAIRQPYPQVDLERLAPALARVFGKAHAREVIERELGRATNPNVRQELATMAAKY